MGLEDIIGIAWTRKLKKLIGITTFWGLTGGLGSGYIGMQYHRSIMNDLEQKIAVARDLKDVQNPNYFNRINELLERYKQAKHTKDIYKHLFMSSLIGHLLMGGSVIGIDKGRRIRPDNKSKGLDKITDFLIDHHRMTSMFAGMTYFMYHAKVDLSIDQNSKFVYMGVAVASCLNIALGLLTPYNPPYIKNMFKQNALETKLNTNPQQRNEIFDSLLYHVVYDNWAYWRIRGRKEENFDEALLCYSRGAAVNKKNKENTWFQLNYFGLLSKYFVPLSVVFPKDLKIALFGNDEQKIRRYPTSLMMYCLYDNRAFFSLFSNVLSKAKSGPEIKAYTALSYGLMGQEKKSSSQWVKLLKDLLAEGRGFEIIGGSRNKVMSYSSSSFLHNTFRIKELDLVSQSIESDDTKMFHKKLGPKIIKHIASFYYSDKQYFMTKYSGKTLFEIFSKSDKEYISSISKECMEMLAEIHLEGRALDNKDVVEEDNKYFVTRLRNIFFNQIEKHIGEIDEDLKKTIEKSHHYVDHVLRSEKLRFYAKDYSQLNLVVNDLDGVVVLDFEKRVLLPPQLDIATYHKYSKYLFSRTEIEANIGYYIDRLNNRRITVDENNFIKCNVFCEYQKELELVGYMQRDLQNGFARISPKQMIFSAAEQINLILDYDIGRDLAKEFTGAKEALMLIGDRL